MRYFLLLCFASLAFGQTDTNAPTPINTNRLVMFYADNQPHAGLTNYPKRIEETDLLTIPAGWNTNFIGGIGWEEYIAPLRAAMGVAGSNAAFQAAITRSNNLARLIVLYDAIPSTRTTLRNFANGTNVLNNTQRDAALRQQADYTENLMEFIQRLGPVLKELYRPEKDGTQ